MMCPGLAHNTLPNKYLFWPCNEGKTMLHIVHSEDFIPIPVPEQQPIKTYLIPILIFWVRSLWYRKKVFSKELNNINLNNINLIQMKHTYLLLSPMMWSCQLNCQMVQTKPLWIHFQLRMTYMGFPIQGLTRSRSASFQHSNYIMCLRWIQHRNATVCSES